MCITKQKETYWLLNICWSFKTFEQIFSSQYVLCTQNFKTNRQTSSMAHSTMTTLSCVNHALKSHNTEKQLKLSLKDKDKAMRIRE